MHTIQGLIDGKRVPSKELEETIQRAIHNGYRQLEIVADGQHGIGGRIWPSPDKTSISVTGTSGQRLAGMGMLGTDIVVHGSCSDDVGWLNCGATITVLGDVANGAHNAGAQGILYVQGGGGARCDTMTKFNPRFEPLQSWYFRDVGDSFAEFKAGGIAVVCGVNPRHADNILGYRPCVGMVGGTIYFRGPTTGHSSSDVKIAPLTDADWQWLTTQMKPYLKAIDRLSYLEELSHRNEWQKIVALSPLERGDLDKKRLPMDQFRLQTWEQEVGQGGIVGDLLDVERTIIPYIVSGDDRRQFPSWDNGRFLAPCAYSCPTEIPTHERTHLLREGKTQEALDLILQYSPFPGTVCGQVCPNPCMDACTRGVLLKEPVDIALLGSLSLQTNAPEKATARAEKVAVIGGGPGGIAAAWHLLLAGVQVSLYEREEALGGKIYQCIPEDRLPREILHHELERFCTLGPDIHVNTKVDRKTFEQFCRQYDAVVLATGAHAPRVIPFPGYEDVIPGIVFLKGINARTPMNLEGKRVVVIGAGNVGMDIAVEAYNQRAASVIAVDIQEPASFGKEQQMAKALGTQILFPKFTDRYSKADNKLYFKDGSDLDADVVMISIGETPELEYLPEGVELFKGYVKADSLCRTTIDRLYAIGDVAKPGLITHALGNGLQAARTILADFDSRPAAARSDEMVNYDTICPQYYEKERLPQPKDGDTEALKCMSCGLCRDCGICEQTCYWGAISRQETEDGGYEYVVDDNLCIGCGFCAAVCPCGIWQMNMVEDHNF
ncbi:MAG: FAD-dependent oxidoreductase [Deltaproteobacteria bacterium]|nr:FAD-dependent oxidoreductase [Candidatus Anaeroferrophillus wilburensis]MBN2887740.1 FAD-dependent oxidoreductase [Deltaproteobacteria bacterium]